jgi:hypothetical protein
MRDLLGMVLRLIAWLMSGWILRLELGLIVRLRLKWVLLIGLMLGRIARRPLRWVSSKGVVTGNRPRRAWCLLRSPSCR